jgi:hypothetical protein
MIGASDIAYIICQLKNSMEVWKYDLAEDRTKAMPKPLFTRGESKKRQFAAKTTMSDAGMKCFHDGVLNWKMVFNHQSGDVYGSLVNGWSSWLEDEASSLDIEGGWRTKNLHSLFKTREGEKEADDDLDEGKDGNEGQLLYCDDSDGDDGFMATVARGGQHQMIVADNEDKEAGGDEDEDGIANDNDNDNSKHGD